jgi:6-phospho-beta-glucosidase
MPAPSERQVAVIGGGGFRTPRLLSGLLRHSEELGLKEIVLYDADPVRVSIMGRIGQYLARMADSTVTVREAPSLEEASRDADFVLLTFRPGGEEARVWDERVAMAEGILGQETVGPGGFFAALRSLALVQETVVRVRRVNPDAWFINFINPVGIVSEAMAQAGERRFVGVCDTPHHLVQELAAYLGTAAEALRVEMAGLNHLGWVLRVWHQGEDVLPQIFDDLPEVVRRIRPLSFFTPDEIRLAGGLPTEYVYLYLHAEEVARRMTGHATRGEQVRDRSLAFFQEASDLLGRAPEETLWTRYLEALVGRSNSYLQQETDTSVARTLSPATIIATEGYERVAIDAMLGLTGLSPRMAIVNGPSCGLLTPAIPSQAVSEATRVIDRHGPVPLPLSRPLPALVSDWLSRVKDYELATVEAFRAGTGEALAKALRQNPLVGREAIAKRLIHRRRQKPPGWLMSPGEVLSTTSPRP